MYSTIDREMMYVGALDALVSDRIGHRCYEQQVEIEVWFMKPLDERLSQNCAEGDWSDYLKN